MDVPTDGTVDESLRADELDCMEQIHDYLVYISWALPKFLLNARAEVELAERSQFETPRELNVSLPFLQVSDSNEAHDADFEDSVASVLSNEQIDA